MSHNLASQETKVIRRLCYCKGVLYYTSNIKANFAVGNIPNTLPYNVAIHMKVQEQV